MLIVLCITRLGLRGESKEATSDRVDIEKEQGEVVGVFEELP